jgi:hypothetical protein
MFAMVKRKKSWQEISKEPYQIEKRHVKDAAPLAEYKPEQLVKGLLAHNTALNKMGYNRAGQVEVYKTQAARLLQDYGYEPTPAAPAQIRIIDARAPPPALTEYPERWGTEDEDAIMMFDAAYKQPEACEPKPLACVEYTSRSHRNKNAPC